ncbi:MAG: hypothetical protein HYZ57_15050, partial [Acidobacteria bacterium]|nr:hypothetical protein [Acidobacteriota bacterium]
MLFFAAVVSIQLSNCVPARWPWGDGASLSLLEGSPINCLVVEEPQWNAAFLRAAQARKISMLAAVSDAQRARKAAALGFDALVVEGDASVDLGATGKRVVELPMRAKIRLEADVAGTVQGLWPGVRAQTDGVAHAGPTGAPWIDTNTGFLRYLRASARP